MDKLEYISKQFSRTNRKSYELYVTTRLWNRLNRLDVELITQQPVKGTNGTYFTDIYFPQLKLHIEINEGYHKHPTQEQLDKIRQADIINVTGHSFFTIDATKNIEELNIEIDEKVKLINNSIIKLGEYFETWDNIEKSSQYYINQGFMDSRNNVTFNKIYDICNCFGYSYKGFQRGGVKHPILEDYFIWFPKLYPNDKWDNSISDDDNVIYEKYLESDEANEEHLQKTLKSTRNKRIVFARVISPLGDVKYRFKGVYKTDVEESLKLNCCVYRKINDKIETISI